MYSKYPPIILSTAKSIKISSLITFIIGLSYIQFDSVLLKIPAKSKRLYNIFNKLYFFLNYYTPNQLKKTSVSFHFFYKAGLGPLWMDYYTKNNWIIKCDIILYVIRLLFLKEIPLHDIKCLKT